YQRLLADPRTSTSVRAKLTQAYAQMDPVRLLSEMRTGQQRLVAIADQCRPTPVESLESAPALDRFLSGLRTAWKEGEIRPTAKPKPKQKRGRRRPDPFAEVTEELRAWFDEEPWRTSRELLERLQAEHPGKYRDHLLRTLQRRVKIWRKEKAHAMVFGAPPREDVDIVAK
ncbi:MAG: transposase, partial [bacterium]|nr:transposase [bacterium]